MTSYIAFLRGINIGKRKVLMEDVQNVFVSHGFSTVKTLIASGNVLFASSEKDEKKLCSEIEKNLFDTFGFGIFVILKSKEEIESLIKKEPFGSGDFEKGTRLQITLFSEDITSSETIEKEGFEIHVVDKRTLASIVYPEGKTTELMTFIDKMFGRNSTTRNWNTIQKLVTL